MEKLEKLSLKELENTAVVMRSVEEQREIVGGYIPIGFDGDALPYQQNPTIVSVLSPKNMNDLRLSMASRYTTQFV